MGRKKTLGSNALQFNEQESNKLIFLKTLQGIKIKDFGINKLKQEMNIKEFMRQQDRFIYNDPVQRNADAWDDLKGSMLMHSYIMGIPVPNIYVQLVNGKYNVIDGKQRLTKTIKFVENKMPLHKDTPPVTITDEEGNVHEYPIANHMFTALPEEFQNRILGLTLVFELLEMDDEIKNLVFQRLNNNESLNAIEKLEAHMDNATIDYLSTMTNNPLIQNVSISGNLRNRKGDREVIVQSMLFIDKDGETGIGSADYTKWVIDTGVPTEAKRAFAESVQYLNLVVDHIDNKHYKETFKKTHIPMLCMVAKHAQATIAPEDFANWLISFLVERYKDESYREFASNKAASKENTSARYRLMLKDFNKTFNLS
ncbi:DUF262 domain-containing protein [Brevibacillus sp. NRS-1366]|uniref:DUF262 domain-containing protein n=1 Tax=Brevibacillus sp. NRS-1366 TaxID=3233899 RepID=UPI003D1D929B